MTERWTHPLPTKHELILELVEGLEADLDEVLDILKEICSNGVYPTRVYELLKRYGRLPRPGT